VTAPTSAFTVAKQLLGDMSLTPGQLAQLRAIDRKYQQALFTLLGGSQRRPTDSERSRLDAIARAEILEMLTPEQRRHLSGGGHG
jgi:Spy/CpxP family protein refolding chaperone